MLVSNSQFIEQSAKQPGRSGKFIVNDSAIAFFSTSQQHNSVKVHGLSYEDDYRGNALAGTFAPGRVDIRFHRDFSDEHVRNIWTRVCTQKGLEFLSTWVAFYQGRKL